MKEIETGVTQQAIPQAFAVGVIVEQRDSDNPWIDAVWQTVEVQPDFAVVDAWKPLTDGEGWKRFLAGSLDIELFKRETEAYKMNFSQEQPVVYVVLRPGEDDGEADVVPFLATLSPYEAEDYAESGEMILVDTSGKKFRRQYENRSSLRFNELKDMLRSVNVDCISVNTDKPYIQDLIAFFRMRRRRY